MSINDFLKKALDISNNVEYRVIDFSRKHQHLEIRNLTFLKLGIELINKHSEIKEIHIIYKKEKKKIC